MSKDIERAIWEWCITPVMVPNPKLKSPREGFSPAENAMVFERDRFAQPDFVLAGRDAYIRAKEAQHGHIGVIDETRIAGVLVLYVPSLPDDAIHVVTKFGSR